MKMRAKIKQTKTNRQTIKQAKLSPTRKNGLAVKGDVVLAMEMVVLVEK
jgi:hypothetical protein